ncbi:serine/threonine-protein kinase [Paractinoplanes hotanensis]|uniref:Serine/threonine protein kinase n=1 Tax=Paractinoplanes hotanensis TaxID=2906497 RepID=A0ABT0YAC1_9ACTN|nr:serine/threonine-protein kinase [Actinoplanes hotanensis]MCM4082730.1 serine/threonine protein kinase [Actinoplanes hotanensis]
MQKIAGRYRVGEVLGQGGSAVVRYGFDSVLKRPVAIKMFDVSATGVLAEARTAAGLSHPNIAQIYDYGEIVDGDDRTPYLVMEFVGGETLADLIARTGPLRWRRAAEICGETASALAVAHGQNLVHRDVNPRNIMLTPDGVKVLDFGIAAVAGQNGIDANGALWGSPAYLAPEQLRGEPSFPAADVYGVGLLLFECLTGSRAWPGEAIGAVLAARHGRPAPRLPRLGGVPRELVRLYEACTTEDPEGRPPAADVAANFLRVSRPAPLTRQVRPVAPVRSALHAAGQATVAVPVAPTSRQRSRRRALVMGSAAVVAAIVSVVGVQLANGTVTPGGREAEAAVEGPRPVATSPQTSSSPAPSPSASVRTRQTNASTTVHVRRKTTAPRTTRATTPATTAPTTPPAKPSSPPASTPPPQKPTPTPTPDETTPPTEPTVEPTDPATTTPPEPDPPASTGPETPADDQRGLV